MRIHLVFPALPPAIDGIGDHTAHLATALAARCDVKVLTAEEAAAPLPGVQVERAFSVAPRGGVRGLLDAVRRDRPDWVVLQFEQFSYGRYGFNPYLPQVMRAIKRECPGTRIALLAHEDFVYARDWKTAIMQAYQQRQFRQLGRAADVIFISIEEWARKYRPWFPGTPIVHLPVPSNIPLVPADRRAVRRRLGISDETFVLGLFGNVNAVRRLDAVASSAARIQAHTPDVALLYVGVHGAHVRATLPGVRVVDAGPLAAADVSGHLSAMDLYLAPFFEGVTSRRGSFMAAIQHGLATVTTSGPETDPLLQTESGRAFVMADASDSEAFARLAEALYLDASRRAGLARAGKAFYDATFDWSIVAERLRSTLDAGRVQAAARSLTPA